MPTKSKSPKKITLQQFAPACLWISGIAALVVVITLIVKLLVFIGLYFASQSKSYYHGTLDKSGGGNPWPCTLCIV